MKWVLVVLVNTIKKKIYVSIQNVRQEPIMQFYPLRQIMIPSTKIPIKIKKYISEFI